MNYDLFRAQKFLLDLTPAEFHDHLDALRFAAKSDDGGLSMVEFIRSDMDPQRYSVVFQGVYIGWIVRATTTTGRWNAYVAQPGSVTGSLVGEFKTRKQGTVEIIWKAGR